MLEIPLTNRSRTDRLMNVPDIPPWMVNASDAHDEVDGDDEDTPYDE